MKQGAAEMFWHLPDAPSYQECDPKYLKLLILGSGHSVDHTIPADLLAHVIVDRLPAVPARPEQGLLIAGIPEAEESAVLLFPEPIRPSQQGVYYRVHRIWVVGDRLEIEVRNTVEGPKEPYVIYQFDRRLNVVGIQPNPVLDAVAFPGLRGTAYWAAVKEKLGRVRVLRNALGRS